MLYADAVRGHDATGVFGVTKEGNVDIKKQAAAASIFVSSTEFSSFKAKIVSAYHAVIGHNRKATHGEKRHEDAHPFWDKNNNIVLVHNGMISNHKEFCKDSTVDSAAIANVMAEKKHTDVLSEVTGAYAFIWYDVKEKKVFFARNESRPLFIVETDGLFALASEPQLAGWTLSRNNQKVIAVKPVEDHVLYQFDLANHLITEVTKYEQKKIYTTTTYRRGGTTNNVIYLPSQKQVSYPQHKPNIIQRGLNRLFNTNEDIGDVDANCFLDDNDLVSRERAMELYKNGDTIYVNISTYNEALNKGTGEIKFVVQGTPINVSKPWLIVKAYLSKQEFDLIELTDVFEFKIKSISRDKDMNVLIYGELGNDVRFVNTNNDKVITESMFFDTVFPEKCDLCRDHMIYKDLPECTIELEQKQIKHALCPKCTAKYESSKEK